MARIDKSDFIKSLTEEQFKAGQVRLNLPDDEDLTRTFAESLWGWVAPEDKELIRAGDFTGTVKVILLNQPLNFYHKLKWGTEVVARGIGEGGRLILDQMWVRNELLLWDFEAERR